MSGAGRTGPGETVDHAAGVLLDRVEGEVVSAGDVVATVHAGDAARLPAAVDELRAALGTGPGRGPAGEVADRLRGW
ncbi:hypothetical protein AB6N35_10975 [Dietzia cinnamea]|uniref:Pyrimidine nucleoside phosphorylase C-terminal domain-containing protein n=1 Tax=Dietzia cinnamea TaxID=321318 RepID=A0ABV3YJH6_9ACTN